MAYLKHSLLVIVVLTIIATVVYELYFVYDEVNGPDFLYDVADGLVYLDKPKPPSNASPGLPAPGAHLDENQRANLVSITPSVLSPAVQYTSKKPPPYIRTSVAPSPTGQLSDRLLAPTHGSKMLVAPSRIRSPRLNQPHIAQENVVFGSSQWSIVNVTTSGFVHMEVRSNALFLDRVHHYNEAASQLRSIIWKARKRLVWKEIDPSLSVVWGSHDDFLQQLSNFSHVKTLSLPWNWDGEQAWSSLADAQNMLIQKYYEWSATYPLTMWISSLGFTKARYDAVFNKTCSDDMERTLNPQSLEYVYLHGKPINPNHYWPNNGDSYPDYFYHKLPPAIFYLHYAEDAVITPPGDIISANLKLVPYTCAQDTDPHPPPGYDTSPIYREVFIMTQFWGNEFFHRMLEVLPRIAPYLHFLHSNKDILVHVNGESAREILHFLGIASERLVMGTCRAKVVYMPQGTPCGFPNPHQLQLLSYELKKSMSEQFSMPSSQNSTSRNLVLIKRTGLRQFIYQETLEKTLSQIAGDYGLELQIFPDNPTPPLYRTFHIFNKASVIVAPHGAGLSNMLFSPPGILILEGVCNPPHVNLCFQWAAHGLGHRYHAIPSRGGCESRVEVFPETIDYVLRQHLALMKKKSMI